MSKKKKFLLVTSIIIFIVVTLVFLFGSLEPIDNLFYDIIINFKSSTLTHILKLFTTVGGVYILILIGIILLIFNRKYFLYFLINVGVINLVNQLLKHIFMRPRPDHSIRLIEESGYSFPSGHTMNAIGAYGLVLFFVLTSKLSKKIKYILSTIIIILMIFVPLSRVYLGVHYFTDILAGAALSIIWLVLFTEYIKKKDI